MNANWVNQIEIGTSATTADPPVYTYSKLCKGIEGMEFAENEQNQQFFFLCGEGFANNETTGAAPELTITGRRIVGDAAQDYIAGLQFITDSILPPTFRLAVLGYYWVYLAYCFNYCSPYSSGIRVGFGTKATA